MEKQKEVYRNNSTRKDPDQGDEHLMFSFWLGLPKPEKEENKDE